MSQQNFQLATGNDWLPNEVLEGGSDFPNGFSLPNHMKLLSKNRTCQYIGLHRCHFDFVQTEPYTLKRRHQVPKSCIHLFRTCADYGQIITIRQSNGTRRKRRSRP